MKILHTVALVAFSSVALAGCVIAPVGPPPGAVVVAPPGVYVPPGVVYVAPRYVSPGPGWVWMYGGRYGWGYHHPQYGWNRGRY
jgi:hypothetical protein